MAHSDEEFDQYGNEPIAPLSGHAVVKHVELQRHDSNNTTTTVNSGNRYVSKPQYAQSMASGVSSNIGHTTYFDQMEHFDKTLKSNEPNETKCNRIYSYFNLIDFLLQIAMITLLILRYFEIYDSCASKYTMSDNNDDGECIGETSQCSSDSKCDYDSSICECIPSYNPYLLLLIIYLILFILSTFILIYRSCLICYALGEGKRNKKLFVKNQVMHQIWMDRISDNCCIAFLNIFCCCFVKNNIAILAYKASIDQNKTFPTTASFIIDITFKILNVTFCVIYIIFQEIKIEIIIICLCFIMVLLISLNRVRLKRKAHFERRRASITKNSINI